MRIIISHDVDHLYGREHWFRDLVYPKLWIRETLNLLQRRIPTKEWLVRCLSCFKHERNYIKEIVAFDRECGVPSTFFFGMAQGSGMSYKPWEAESMIQYVKNSGFSVGTHGIAYDTAEGIAHEKRIFFDTVGFESSGIRMHYVRFTDETFRILDKVGYAYDSTEFDKRSGCCVKAPYQVGRLWEFPLTIMDSYLPYDDKIAKQFTIDVLKRAGDEDIGYCTILFHDVSFSEAYEVYKNWYQWFIGYCKANNMHFISYIDAIQELEMKCRGT